MKKPEGQEGAPVSETQEPRKLNMEEKRKLEKLLISDIDSAVARYNAQAEDMRGTLINKLTKTPPADAKKLFDSYVLAQKQVGHLKSKLSALGRKRHWKGTLWAVSGRPYPSPIRSSPHSEAHVQRAE
jgi:hypothetical protein